MQNSIENILNKFNNSILKINWFDNIGQNLQKETKNHTFKYASYLSPRIKEKVDIIKTASTWTHAKSIINNPDCELFIWGEEKRDENALYNDILRKTSEKDLQKYLSLIAQTSNESINNMLIKVAKKNNIEDPYFVKVAGGAAALACYQKALIVASENLTNHIFNTKFKIYTSGHWPLTMLKSFFWVF